MSDMEFCDTVPLYPELPNDYDAGFGQLPPELSVYFPDPESATGLAVLICPGGGYGQLSLQKEGHRPARWLASLGHLGVVLRYRFAPYRHPVPLRDVRAALSILRSRSDEWRIHPKGLALMGFSAGGHLAASATTLEALDGEKSVLRPDLLILGYPVISMVEGFAHLGSRNNLLGENCAEDLARSVSPERFVRPEMPPTFLFHASDDTSVPVEHSVLFYQKLVSVKVSAEMHLYSGGGHGFGMGDMHGWTMALDRWMRIRARKLLPS